MWSRSGLPGNATHKGTRRPAQRRSNLRTCCNTWCCVGPEMVQVTKEATCSPYPSCNGQCIGQCTDGAETQTEKARSCTRPPATPPPEKCPKPPCQPWPNLSLDVAVSLRIDMPRGFGPYSTITELTPICACVHVHACELVRVTRALLRNACARGTWVICTPSGLPTYVHA